MKKGKGLSKGIKILIIFLSVSAAVIFSLVVTNFFIPVKYLAAYINFSHDVNPQNRLRIRFTDAGYGDCALIELPDGKVMLVDGGNGSYSDTYALIRLLNVSGIDVIDYLVCTSVRGEHCGGLAEIVRAKSVKTVYLPYVTDVNITDEYAEFYNAVLKEGASIETAEYGKGVINGEFGYFFGFLSPTVHLYAGSEYADMNLNPTPSSIGRASAVMWLDCHSRGYLFLSDATDEIQNKICEAMRMENNLLNLNGQTVKLSPCTAVKVAEHCAADSVNSVLYDFLSPESAIISVGENAFGAPSASAMDILKLYVPNVYRTDTDGSITVISTEVEYFVSKEIK